MKTKERKRAKELAALLALKKGEIDTSDIPELVDWSAAVVGRFYRPAKKPVTLRLDADVLAWLKAAGPGYQTRINRLLRELMLASSLRRRRARRRVG